MPARPAPEEPSLVEGLRKLYENGQLTEVIGGVESAGSESTSLQLILALALFDRGDAVRSLQVLRDLSRYLVAAPAEVQFRAELARLTGESADGAASATSSNLAVLGQLATSNGQAASLAGRACGVTNDRALGR